MSEKPLLPQSGCLKIALFVISLFMLIFVNLRSGFWGGVLSIIVATVLLASVLYFINKANKSLEFEPKEYMWCKSCRHFKKVKNWDYSFSQPKKIVNDSEVPCKIFNQSERVWIDYFNLSPKDRKLYPDNCKYWSKN